MGAVATIVFREILEIALVLGIVMAATRGLPKRATLVTLGLLLGVFGSFIIFLLIDVISDAIDGVGQEVFNAAIIFTAVAFLSWTVIWMKRHGRDLVRHINEVGADVVAGRKSVYFIVFVVGLTIFREGSEIVLFTHAQIGIGTSLSSIITGSLIGLVGGTFVGIALYFGLLKTVKRHLFTVTSWMLIILTAGMAAQGANYLIQADILPALHPQLWDTSAFLDGEGLLGETLKVLVGYTPRPTGMELLFYVVTLCVVSLSYRYASSAGERPAPSLSQDNTVNAE